MGIRRKTKLQHSAISINLTAHTKKNPKKQKETQHDTKINRNARIYIKHTTIVTPAEAGVQKFTA